ncbi:MAG: 16S/23S rRNA (cytidine-2'-O)-methyltransferase TlyA [Solirubrobacteraceae bacterium]
MGITEAVRYRPPMPKRRLDALLTERGLFESRSRAAAAVMAGHVRLVGSAGAKPGQMVAEDVEIEVAERPRFVSRGGIKLANALAASGVPVAGRGCLDVGASTGGFSDCLLQAGATRVSCVDVAYGELAWSLRGDARVTLLERTNARGLRPDMLTYAPELIVVDVSFISLRTVLPAVLACGAPGFDALALVKPQFELGRGRVKGGVVRTAPERREALRAVGEAVLGGGWGLRGFHSSGLPGPKGNKESFAHITPPLGADQRSAAELALEAEPA